MSKSDHLIPMGECPDTGLPIVLSTGLVPVEILIAEAGFGLIKGEIRGVPPNVAATMISRKPPSAKLAGQAAEMAKPAKK